MGLVPREQDPEEIRYTRVLGKGQVMGSYFLVGSRKRSKVTDKSETFLGKGIYGRKRAERKL